MNNEQEGQVLDAADRLEQLSNELRWAAYETINTYGYEWKNAITTANLDPILARLKALRDSLAELEAQPSAITSTTTPANDDAHEVTT